MENKYCSYYQAYVSKADTWFLTATLRSFEHLTFDRSLHKETFLFEFFVPVDLEPYFLELMKYYQERTIVTGLQKLTNRLQDSLAEV